MHLKNTLLVIAVIVVIVAVTAPRWLGRSSDGDPDPDEMAGPSLLQLDGQPESLSGVGPGLAARRARLDELGADRGTEERRQEYRELLLWFVRSHPGDEILQKWRFTPLEDPEGWAAAIELLQDLAEDDDAPSDVLHNYAQWMLATDRDTSYEVYERLQQREPEEPLWHSMEATLIRLDRRTGDIDSPEAIARAEASRDALAEALRFVEGPNRVQDLASGVEAAVLAGDRESAERWAAELFTTPPEWDEQGSRRRAHQALGILALRDGDPSAASAQLAAMATAEPGRTGRSFGPQMLLARELLLLGHRQPVLDFLDVIALHWSAGQCTAWQAEIAAGQIPNFGAHLRY